MERPAIRSAVAADCAALTELCLRSKASNGYDAAFMAACRAELTITPETLEKNSLWVVEKDQGLLGCVALCPTVTPTAGEVALFFVDPDCQRQGIGRQLWQVLLEQARLLGQSTLTLDADPQAVPFYESLGFVVCGETPSGSIPGRVLPKMTLRI
ncbi:MAG: GNAT family N-acetyltransferase [Pseudomonadota bacterium]